MPIGFSSFYFLFGRFHAFFLKAVGQYNHRMAVKEAEYPMDIGTILDSALPDVRCPDQLLEIGDRDHLNIFQKTQHPRHLLCHLAGQGIKKILDGTFPIRCLIKCDGSGHGYMLTSTLTYVKVIVSKYSRSSSFITRHFSPLFQFNYILPFFFQRFQLACRVQNQAAGFPINILYPVVPHIEGGGVSALHRKKWTILFVDNQ
jgi:hypothetical protein